MNVKLRFVALLLALLVPAILGAAPAPQPAGGFQGLSPLNCAVSTTCSSADCAAQCDPCGWKFYGCVNGEAICACRVC